MNWAAIGIAFKLLCQILHPGECSQMHHSKSWQRIVEYACFFLHSIHRYYLQFEARMGMRIYSDVAIDDFSMSPECFGLNIPAEHLQGYNYYDQRILQDKTPHDDFVNHTGTIWCFCCPCAIGV